MYLLSAILSEIQKEPCTVFLSISLSFSLPPTQCKPMSYMDCKKIFAVIVENSLTRKIFGKQLNESLDDAVICTITSVKQMFQSGVA